MHSNYVIPGVRGPVAVMAERGPVTTETIAAEVQRLTREAHEWMENNDTTAVRADLDAVRAGLRDLEQRMAEGGMNGMLGYGGAGRDPAAALAAHLNGDSAFGDVLSGRNKGGTVIDIDAGMLLGNVEASTTTTDDGGLAVRQNVGVAGVVERQRFVRQRLRTQAVTGGSVEYSRESWTNNATEQGSGSPIMFEGTAKAETDVSFTLIDEKVRTIAHFCKASTQILQDVAGLQQFLSNRLLHGLELRLETSILAGTGAGAQQKGLFHADNRTAFTPVSGFTAIDNISAALGIAANSYEVMPDLLLLNPIDYRSMQREKAVDSGVYLWGGPGAGQGADTASAWEVPIHASPAVPQGDFAITEVGQMGFLAIRSNARVEIGLAGDDFTNNLRTLLAEMRALLVVERPTATQYGSLTL